MSDFDAYLADPARLTRYTEQGPPAFTPGHAGMLQMTAVSLTETVPAYGTVTLRSRPASLPPAWGGRTGRSVERVKGIEPSS